MQELSSLWPRASVVVAHNVRFDLQLIQFSCDRTSTRLPRLQSFCTMRESTKIINLPGGKWPRLEEAYRFYFGETIDDAHDALADVRACMRVFFALKNASAPTFTGNIIGRTARRTRSSAVIPELKEFEEHQRLIEALTEIHREAPMTVDWSEFTDRPEPETPIFENAHERVANAMLRTYRPTILDWMLFRVRANRGRPQHNIVRAREHDAQGHAEVMKSHSDRVNEFRANKELARRVQAGDTSAYEIAIQEFMHCEPSLIGRDLLFSFPDADSAEVTLFANSEKIIPAESKKLLASGRISVRTQSKKAFSALYQHHLCSCVFRISRDAFAVLPVRKIVIHISAELLDTKTGHFTEQCILSASILRAQTEELDFERIDPVDAMENFECRMRISKGTLCAIDPIRA